MNENKILEALTHKIKKIKDRQVTFYKENNISINNTLKGLNIRTINISKSSTGSKITKSNLKNRKFLDDKLNFDYNYEIKPNLNLFNNKKNPDNNSLKQKKKVKLNTNANANANAISTNKSSIYLLHKDNIILGNLNFHLKIILRAIQNFSKIPIINYANKIQKLKSNDVYLTKFQFLQFNAIFKRNYSWNNTNNIENSKPISITYKPIGFLICDESSEILKYFNDFLSLKNFIKINEIQNIPSYDSIGKINNLENYEIKFESTSDITDVIFRHVYYKKYDKYYKSHINKLKSNKKLSLVFSDNPTNLIWESKCELDKNINLRWRNKVNTKGILNENLNDNFKFVNINNINITANNICKMSNKNITKRSKKRINSQKIDGSSTMLNDNKQHLVVFNFRNLKLKFDNKRLTEILNYLNNYNINCILSKNDEINDLFFNLDIIVDLNISILVIHPEIFEDEYNSKPYEYLNDALNKNIYRYNKLIIAFDIQNNQKLNFGKIKKNLATYITKRFQENLKILNTEIHYTQYTNLTEFCQFILNETCSLSCQFNLKHIGESLLEPNKIEIKEIKLTNGIYPFLNLIETVIISNTENGLESEYEEVVFIKGKYKNKNILIN